MEESKAKLYSNTGNLDVINLIPYNAEYILDIGCGDGAVARVLTNRNCVIDGVTISQEEQKIAGKVMRHVHIFNLENGLPDLGINIYDVVICSHVLEHICYPENLMNDIYKVLKPKGILIVALPNIMHYKSRWQLLLGNFNYQSAGIWDYTHFRWYTFETAQKLLLQYNFSIVNKTVTGMLPLNSFFTQIFSDKVNLKLFVFLTSISTGFFGYQLLYCAIKKS